jgi:hypothetical protein
MRPAETIEDRGDAALLAGKRATDAVRVVDAAADDGQERSQPLATILPGPQDDGEASYVLSGQELDDALVGV